MQPGPTTGSSGTTAHRSKGGATTGGNSREQRGTRRSNGTDGNHTRERRNSGTTGSHNREQRRNHRSKGATGQPRATIESNGAPTGSTEHTGAAAHKPTDPRSNGTTGSNILAATRSNDRGQRGNRKKNGATEPPGATTESTGARTGETEQPGATFHKPTDQHPYYPQTQRGPKPSNRGYTTRQRGAAARVFILVFFFGPPLFRLPGRP